MRVRKRQGVENYLAAHQDLVVTAPSDWAQIFGKNQPLQIEVGCGKGDFILGMAKKYPEINFIGIDLQETIVSYALDKLLLSGLTNVRLLLTNGALLTQFFEPQQVDQIYLNFSDPWPKKRHARRRLTSKDFLKIFETLIKSEGRLVFKTDNRGLFEWSLVSLSAYGMTLEEVSLDLHQKEALADQNVMTEYERKFSSKGQPIYRLAARFNSQNH